MRSGVSNARKDLVLDLLLPGTPKKIADRYISLEQRSKEIEFGPLEQDIVVCDTETTGLSFRDSELIQIAAARIQGHEISDRFDTFVHPEKPIPLEVSQLTNITALDVVDAPKAREAVHALADFVGGAPILAHNAVFDRTFIEKVPGGHQVCDLWIDTLALSRIALPRLRTHKLSDMAQAFGCDPVTHRANDDVDALSGMWRIILLGLYDLPEGLCELLSQMHTEIEWQYRPIFSYIAQIAKDKKQKKVFHLGEVRTYLQEISSTKAHEDAQDIYEPKHVTCEELRRAFAPGGIISRMYESYEARPEQLCMANEVASALNSSTHCVVEAGTGVGKSVAYLLPEILFAKRNNVTLGVATKTNALTDQLMTHELPALDRVLSDGVKFTSLKGYEHYPCLLRMERLRTEELPISCVCEDGLHKHRIAIEMLNALAVTYAFVCQSPEGDLDTLGIRWRYIPRTMLTTTASQCLRTRCPYFPNACLLYSARRHAARANIVVTNHSLLLRDVMTEGHILPPIRYWVIDEAHGFEAEARKQWAYEVSADTIRGGFELLGGTKTGLIRMLLVSLAKSEDSALIVRQLTKLSASTTYARKACVTLFEKLSQLGRSIPKKGDFDRMSLWIDDKVRLSASWRHIEDAGNEALEALDTALKDAHDTMMILVESAPMANADLTDATRFMVETRDALRLIVAGKDTTYIYSADLPCRKKDRGTQRLRAEKFDIGADLATHWLPEMNSVIFTSATMAVGKNFAHFDHSVGLDLLDVDQYRDIQLPSSFDYDRNMGVIVVDNLPAPAEKGYIKALCDLLFDIHRAMDGSVLTLFTNRADMEFVFKDLYPRLAAIGLELRFQDKNSSPRHIRESFISDKHQSLLALRSFWEGFDATGDTLRAVVIPKLPFANPRDPLVCERDMREDRSWWRYSLPEAILNVKQAAGRLIRSRSDTGILVLADSRLVTKRYGRQFIGSLPSRSVNVLRSDHIERYIQMWRASRES